jgi:hypothetical protein
MGVSCPSETSVDFTGPCGILSQKSELITFKNIGSEFLKEETKKSKKVWIVPPCSPVEIH